MAKLVALSVAGQPDRMLWIHPDAVERLQDNGMGHTSLYFRSGQSATIEGGADVVASKLNSASG